jgi:hypothetical protein
MSWYDEERTACPAIERDEARGWDTLIHTGGAPQFRLRQPRLLCVCCAGHGRVTKRLAEAFEAFDADARLARRWPYKGDEWEANAPRTRAEQVPLPPRERWWAVQSSLHGELMRPGEAASTLRVDAPPRLGGWNRAAERFYRASEVARWRDQRQGGGGPLPRSSPKR